MRLHKIQEPCATCQTMYPENMPADKMDDNQHRVARILVEVAGSNGVTHKIWLENDPGTRLEVLGAIAVGVAARLARY